MLSAAVGFLWFSSGTEHLDRTVRTTVENVMKRNLPGSYQRLDLFIKVLRVLCPNLTAAPKKHI